MAIRISGTTGIDLNGGSIANAASVNSIIVPEENGEFISSIQAISNQACKDGLWSNQVDWSNK